MVNGKIYVGVHKTKNVNDGYMGSGKLIKRAIKKYGLDNFQKEILGEFSNAADAFTRESEIVTKEFLLRKDVYNLCCGGRGGFDYLNQLTNNLSHSNFHLSKMQSARMDKFPNGTLFGRKHTQVHKDKISISKIGQVDGFKGKTHKEQSKHKIGTANKVMVGPKNSQFGSFWITNGTENKKCRGNIPDGWKRGRVKKLDKQ